MTMEEKIARINALSRKAKTAGLSDAEREEQAQLRRDYIASVKANLKGELDNTYVVGDDGKKTKLADFQRGKKER